MTQLQYLPELLLAVLFSIQASFTHPGVLSPDKEKLGDDELRAIVKRTQTSSEAREVLAFNARVWTAMTETLRSGNDELGGCEHHFDGNGVVVGNNNGIPPSNTGGGGGVGGGGNATSPGGGNGGNMAGTVAGKRVNGVGEQTCTCKDRRDKMYLLPKVWELVILGRNLLATKERGQDLAAESKFEEEVRRLCEICVKHAEKESYHKVLITCLQFLNNLISGNEKRKMSLWMHLFVPGSTRLLEAAKRKAVKQYQKDAAPSPSSSSKSSSDPIKELQLQEALKSPPSSPNPNGSAGGGQAAKLSFVTMLPTILNAKEMLPLLLIIHGSITDIDGTDPARQLMRCKMMLAAEAGIGLMAGLLMFVDAWHEIDDHIYFELILEIMETILHNGLITYLFETLKEYVDCRNYQFEGIHAITPPQAVILRLLHTIYAPAALPTISDPGVFINYDGKLEESAGKEWASPPPPPLLEAGDEEGEGEEGEEGQTTNAVEDESEMDEFTAEFTAALRSDLGPPRVDDIHTAAGEGIDGDGGGNTGPENDDAATEVDIDHSEATPEIVNFLAVKVFKGQLGPAVRDMVTKIGKAMGYSATSPNNNNNNGGSGKNKGASERVLEITEIPTEDGRSITSVAGITIYDVELHYEGLIQLLELLMLFAEQGVGRVYLRETKCVEEIVEVLKCFVEYVPRTGGKEKEKEKEKDRKRKVGGYVEGEVGEEEDEEEEEDDDDGVGMECNDPVEFRWPLIKRTLVQLVSLLVYRSRATQDEVRKAGGVIAVLGCFGIDEENPYIQQHATLCIRNLMEGNTENQKILRELEAREVVNGEALEAAGLEAYVDKSGKVKVGPAPGNNNTATGGGNGGGGKKKKKGKK
ncbi:copper transport protein [Arthrobotrys conoides]|uniref:Ataxin-10 homolog n=1 Tax=Arthrobotrys conoides TaxID=74498 RepID=A0AAN8N8G3_9PEZI